MITLKQIARTPTLLADKLRRLEWQGRYSEALEDCLEIIDGKACVPALEDTTRQERAELLLRYGALIGFCGHISQIANSQEQSKDLLTLALSEFIDLEDEEKTAECENYIALAYWRIGELNESFVWLDSSVSRRCPPASGTRLHTHLVRSLINLEKKDFDKNIALLDGLENIYLENGDPFLLGHYYTNLGVSLKDTGRTTEALGCLKRSLYYHRKARHKISQGIGENNLAQIYWLTGDFEKAHRSIDSATRIFRAIKDKTREGFSYDTKANVFIAEGKFVNALRSIEKAIDILKRGENASYHAEAILTKAKALLYLDRLADAVGALLDAVEIVRMKVGERSARKLIEEFAFVLQEISITRTHKAETTSATGGLNLLLPAGLAHYSSYSGVRVHNSNLDRFGLSQGSLAIVVDEEVQRGDLVAMEEPKTGSVRCGIFDSEFGLVCLDSGDGEPQLFDENDVRILGKIVGVGDEPKKGNGEVVVEPLTSYPHSGI
jgi:tetratricopeptide (TPR) repeat protein